MDSFNPPAPPSYEGNSIKETPRLLSVSFGDGYKQTAPDGLNANDATASFTWSYLTQAQATQMMQFYKSHIGQTIAWNAPGDLVGTNKWRITDMSSSVAGFNWFSITASFERSFELA